VCVQEIRELKKSVGSFSTDEYLTEEREKIEEEEDKKAASYLEDLQIIHILLTGISASAAAAQPNVIKKATYCNDMRMRLGWFQEIINGFYIAQCGRINEIGHDGGSISEAESLCVSIIITDSIGENPNHLVLSSSALPADKTAAGTLACIEYVFARLKEKYTLFLQECVKCGIDISEFPHPDGITLTKMARGCIGMSDNAATALTTTELLIVKVRELVEEFLLKKSLMP
jgi:hypothetical protein